MTLSTESKTTLCVFWVLRDGPALKRRVPVRPKVAWKIARARSPDDSQAQTGSPRWQLSVATRIAQVRRRDRELASCRRRSRPWLRRPSLNCRCRFAVHPRHVRVRPVVDVLFDRDDRRAHHDPVGLSRTESLPMLRFLASLPLEQRLPQPQPQPARVAGGAVHAVRQAHEHRVDAHHRRRVCAARQALHPACLPALCPGDRVSDHDDARRRGPVDRDGALDRDRGGRVRSAYRAVRVSFAVAPLRVAHCRRHRRKSATTSRRYRPAQAREPVGQVAAPSRCWVAQAPSAR